MNSEADFLTGLQSVTHWYLDQPPAGLSRRILYSKSLFLLLFTRSLFPELFYLNECRGELFMVTGHIIIQQRLHGSLFS